MYVTKPSSNVEMVDANSGTLDNVVPMKWADYLHVYYHGRMNNRFYIVVFASTYVSELCTLAPPKNSK